MKKIFLLTFLICCRFVIQASPMDSINTKTDGQNDLFVYSLDEQWMVYDKSLKTYLPYFQTLYDDVNKLHTNIGKIAYKNLYFNILGDSATTIFINQKLSYTFPKTQWVSWSIDSLQKYAQNDILLVSYYSEDKFDKIPEGYLTVKPYTVSKNIPKLTKSTQIARIRKYVSIQKDILIIISGIVLFVVAIICSTYTPLFKWSLLWKNFTNFIQARTQIKRLQSIQFLWYTVYYSLSLAFVMMIIPNKLTGFLTENISLSNTSLVARNVISFFLLFFVLIGSVLLKYIVVALMGNLYYNRQSLNLHLQEYITISQIICSLILLAGLIVAGMPTHWENSVSFLKYATLILIALQTAFIAYRLKQSMSYSMFYFFAYLFSTELLPFLLYTKLFTSL